jgi:hypothetical protein
MARADIHGGETKKDGKLKRFYRWICIPFRRRSNSYIEPSPNVEEGEVIPQPQFDNIAIPFQEVPEKKPFVHHYEEPGEIRHTRGRYRDARPQHPASYSLSQRPPPAFGNQLGCVTSQNYGFSGRDETESPAYDAPRSNSGKRSRSKTEKNKDLPGTLHTQPSPLTRASLEMNERRNSASSFRLLDSVPSTPTLKVRHWSNSSQGTIHTDMRSHHARNDQRVRRDSSTRRPRSSYDEYQHPPARQLSTTREIPRGPRPRHPATGGSLPARPKIVPLCNDSERVLVHSKSRGFKIVRNLLSIDAMRDMANSTYQHDQPRHVSSLERMADEDQQASQELSSQYSGYFRLSIVSVWSLTDFTCAGITAMIAANQQRVPVAHQPYASWPPHQNHHQGFDAVTKTCGGCSRYFR